jgi:hypothetical protein
MRDEHSHAQARHRAPLTTPPSGPARRSARIALGLTVVVAVLAATVAGVAVVAPASGESESMRQVSHKPGRKSHVSPAPTPSPTPTATASTTSPGPTVTPTTASPTPTATASSSVSPTATASATTASPTPTPSQTPTTAEVSSVAPPNSTNCTGGRVFVEAQAWWTKAPGASAAADDFGHVHVGACVPERDTLTASTTIPVRVIMHGNPGTLLDMSVVFKGTDYETTVAKVVPTSRKCSESTCEQWLNAPIDITKFGHSGLQEVRFRVFADEPDGQRMHSSLNWQTYIQNGKSTAAISRMPYLRGKGWYTGFGYCEPDILGVPLPDKPVSGTLKVRVQQVDHGSEDVDPSHHLVALDANAHAGITGTVLAEGDGALPARDILIDTTKLTNGVHRLVQRTDCRSGEQVNSGALAMLFEVNNP